MADPNVALRWNWNTPFFLSVHDPNVFYSGADKVFKSVEEGTRSDRHLARPLGTRSGMASRLERLRRRGQRGDRRLRRYHARCDGRRGERDDRGDERVADSRRNAVHRHGRRKGLDHAERRRQAGGHQRSLPGRAGDDARQQRRAVARRYVDDLRRAGQPPSRNDSSRTCSCRPISARRSGRSRRTCRTASPGSVYVIREDPVNPNLLYVGTETGVFASLNKGQSWFPLESNLPTVPVYDLKIHPRDHELIAATHGRGIQILDVAPLQQMTPAVLSAPNPSVRSDRGVRVRADDRRRRSRARSECGAVKAGRVARRFATSCRHRRRRRRAC